MSVSSHLTPDPERRLWVMHRNIHASLDRADRKLGALLLFAAVELAAIRIAAPAGTMSRCALLALCTALPACIFGLSPLIETPDRMPPLDPDESKPRAGDSLITEHDIAGYSRLELTNFLDRYLGGGITATAYYEDIIAQIVLGARSAARKHRLFGGACVMTAAGQLCLLAALLLG